MQKKKILSLAIATATVVTGLVGVTTATNSPTVLDNGDLKVCGTEYISDSNGAEGCITIQGKNVGSTTTGAGPSAPDTSYGNYYQWGDNTPRTEANWLTNPLWDNNAWGGESDNEDNGYGYPVLTPEERQGPCDIGYHVPSIGEWSVLMDMWADSSVNGRISSNISQFYTDFQIPFAGYRDYENGGSPGRQGTHVHLWSSSNDGWYPRGLIIIDGYGIVKDADGDRRYGFPVRCFKDPVKLISTITENTTTTIGGNAPVTGLPTIMTVTQNTISTAEGKEVLGEVNVDFGTSANVTFSHPVEINIPVSDHEQVIVKVKHGGESEYSFAGLTRNSSASCNNGVPTSNQYNGETINVVDGYATVYSCAASSFIALGVDEGGEGVEGPSTAQIILSVRKGTLTIGTTTGNLNLGEVNVSNNAQELSGSFGANSFWVEDMKGVESGYYTTISVTDLTGSVAGHVISANNVSLKTAGEAPSYISGASVEDSQVVFSNDIKSWHNNWTAPVTYFNRENTPSNLAGRVGKWGDNLQIKVTIPAHTPYDTYRGTITYTLYDQDIES